jgi:hypothetical protein
MKIRIAAKEDGMGGAMGGQGMYWAGMGSAFLIWVGLVIWGVVFTVLVLNKLDKIISVLEKK